MRNREPGAERRASGYRIGAPPRLVEKDPLRRFDQTDIKMQKYRKQTAMLPSCSTYAETPISPCPRSFGATSPSMCF
jgi:hypothetical protein